MKTSTIPAVRVDIELRQAAESVLRDKETLSAFVEQSVQMNVTRRRAQDEFIALGLASRAEAELTGEYYSAQSVMDDLKDILSSVKTHQK